MCIWCLYISYTYYIMHPTCVKIPKCKTWYVVNTSTSCIKEVTQNLSQILDSNRSRHDTYYGTAKTKFSF